LAVAVIFLLGAGIVGPWGSGSAGAVDGWTAPVPAAAGLDAWGQDEREEGYYVIVNEKGDTLLTTGLQVTVGDRFIAEDDREYEVQTVEGDKAWARKVSGQAGGVPRGSPLHSSMGPPPTVDASGPAGATTVVIYHTHSGESYAPSDGSAEIPGHGGIFQVGAAFRDGLKAEGLNAIQSSQVHDPHDNLAYDRSRRTAAALIARYRPAAIFDVHRDSAPPQAYEKTVSGEKVTSVMFVVGRQNPNMQANLAFAKDLKAAADRDHPGLVRAIYFGQGRYNQDLSPRALLIEVGSETNTKAEAERGVALLADDVPKGLRTAGPAGLGLSAQNGAAVRSAITIVAGVILAAGAYLVIASGGFRQAWWRLRRLRSTELAGYLNLREDTRPKKMRGRLRADGEAEENRLTSSRNDTGGEGGETRGQKDP